VGSLWAAFYERDVGVNALVGGSVDWPLNGSCGIGGRGGLDKMGLRGGGGAIAKGCEGCRCAWAFRGCSLQRETGAVTNLILQNE